MCYWILNLSFVCRNQNSPKCCDFGQDALSRSSFENYSSRARDSLSCWTPDSIGFNLIEAVLCHICRKERPGAVLVFMTGWEDISCLRDQIKAHPLLGDPNRVLVLTCHGSMATSEQVRYFPFSSILLIRWLEWMPVCLSSYLLWATGLSPSRVQHSTTSYVVMHYIS